MKYINLTKNQRTLVDDDVHDLLSKHKWHATWSKSANGFYGARKISGKNCFIHRDILGLHPGNPLEGDHINGNTLDNRRDNLRKVTHRQNLMNCRKHRDNTSGYPGVTFHKNMQKWESRYTHNQKRKHIGYFESKIDAAQASLLFRFIHYGEFMRKW